MKIAVPKERASDEGRVAATPDTVKKFVAKTVELGRIPTAEDLAEGGSCGHGCGCHDH